MNQGKFIAISVVMGFIVFIGIAIVTNLFNSNDLTVRITGTLLEAVVTALITYFLLTGQTSQEENKERQVKVFEKKQEVYYNFLGRLKEIIQDGEIHIGTINKDGSVNNSVDELKDLIFQFAYLQLHASEETINGVLDGVANMIQCLNDFNSKDETDKQKKLPEFYSLLSNELFGIIAILKKDLYDPKKDYKPIPEEKMNEILCKCNLSIETTNFGEHELQNYFWDELQKQLIEKGYKIEQKDFRQDVNKYYARERNRHRWFGIEFPAFTKQDSEIIKFRVEIDNNYFYGFYKPKPKQEDAELVKIIKQVSSSFKENDYWYGKKSSDRFDLNFWNLRPQEFEQLKHLSNRKKLLKGIADEIDMYIKEFKRKALQNNL
jgi:hypothetical protein